MALIKCPECGKEVSSSARSCPHCGYQITDTRLYPSQGIAEKYINDTEKVDSQNIVSDSPISGKKVRRKVYLGFGIFLIFAVGIVASGITALFNSSKETLSASKTEEMISEIITFAEDVLQDYSEFLDGPENITISAEDVPTYERHWSNFALSSDELMESLSKCTPEECYTDAWMLAVQFMETK